MQQRLERANAAELGVGHCTFGSGAFFSLSLATPVSAQQFFDGANTISNNSVDGGNGAWDNATTNWSDVDGDNNAAYNSAVSTNFGGGNTGPASGGTVTVDGGGITLSSDVIFGATGDNSIYTIEGGDLTVAAAGGTTFDVSDVSGGVGNDATISSIITGADELTKSGIGTMTLNAANTYTGDTEVNGGTLRIGASERIANTSNLVMGGGTFDLKQLHRDSGGPVRLRRDHHRRRERTVECQPGKQSDLFGQHQRRHDFQYGLFRKDGRRNANNFGIKFDNGFRDLRN